MIRAAGYIRVSSKKQEDEGFSLAEQELKIERQCEFEGWEFVQTFADPGRSGADDDRPGLVQALQAAADGEFDRLVIFKLDRLGRKASRLLDVSNKLKDARVGLVSLNEKIDTTTPHGYMYFTVLAAIAEMELATISLRGKQGRAGKARHGLWSGPPPYGYSTAKPAEDGNDDKTPSGRPVKGAGGRIEIHPEEAEHLQDMFDWWLSGEYTVSAIAKKLTLDGVPTKTGKRVWQAVTVKNALTNPVCTGRLQVTLDPKGANPERIDKENAHEEIITPDVFDRAQRMFKPGNAGDRRGRPPRLGFLLHNKMLVCGDCGSTMRVDSAHDRYSCRGKEIDPATTCAMPRLSRELVDGAVTKYLTRHVVSFEASRAAAEAHLDDRRANSAAALVGARKRLSDVERALRKLDDDWAYGDDTDKATHKRLSAKLAADHEEAVAAVDERVAEAEALKHTTDLPERWAQMRERLSDPLADADTIPTLNAAIRQTFLPFTAAMLPADSVVVGDWPRAVDSDAPADADLPRIKFTVEPPESSTGTSDDIGDNPTSNPFKPSQLPTKSEQRATARQREREIEAESRSHVLWILPEVHPDAAGEPVESVRVPDDWSGKRRHSRTVPIPAATIKLPAATQDGAKKYDSVSSW